MGTAFTFEAHDGAFDNAGVDAIVTRGKNLCSDVEKKTAKEKGMERWMVELACSLFCLCAFRAVTCVIHAGDPI